MLTRSRLEACGCAYQDEIVGALQSAGSDQRQCNDAVCKAVNLQPVCHTSQHSFPCFVCLCLWLNDFWAMCLPVRMRSMRPCV
jgi:hypothetical protein